MGTVLIRAALIQRHPRSRRRLVRYLTARRTRSARVRRYAQNPLPPAAAVPGPLLWPAAQGRHHRTSGEVAA
ncbi:hypothetical protein ACOALZ_15845 [Nocardiopsis algeriensis]|uniref:hypothetical protein n=1 Tax=Nocardiopsis algeriensis TaxID=1478215 RepID=UPI003B439182